MQNYCNRSILWGILLLKLEICGLHSENRDWSWRLQSFVLQDLTNKYLFLIFVKPYRLLKRHTATELGQYQNTE